LNSLQQKNIALPIREKTPKVLVVEDENIIAMDLKVILESFGFDVYGPVPSGETCIKAATFFRPDVVLMDIRLKGRMTGIDAARLIHRFLHIPVIYLTAYGDEAILEEATKVSDFGYIRKPFEESEVENKIRALL
jgi:CheY-like chemotaxis protein